MKQLSKQQLPAIICTAAGLLGLVLQVWLLRSIDEKGLLTPSHPGALLTGFLSAAVMVLLAVRSFRNKPTCHFDSSPVSGIGMLITAAGIASGTWTLIASVSLLPTILLGILGFLSVVCTVFAALMRFKKLRVHPMLYCPVIVFFILVLVCMYRQWSGEPELLRYCYPLLALVFLMLTAYQRAAVKAGISDGCQYLFFSRGALFFCLLAIPASSLRVMLGAMAVGILLDGCIVSTPSSQGD